MKTKIKDKSSWIDELDNFFKEHKDIEISFQSERNFTDMGKLSKYILKLEGAVRYFSKKRLDFALNEYKELNENKN